MRAFPGLARFFARQSTDYLELRDGTPGDWFFPQDGHPNPAGHAWIAERLAPSVSARLAR